MPLHGKGSMRAAALKRQEYIRLRLAGVSRWDATAQVGGLTEATALHYEHWYAAVRDGQCPFPGPPDTGEVADA